MISPILFNTLYKTLNYSQQQYKETEEIVEKNPAIIKIVNNLDTQHCCLSIDDSKLNTISRADIKHSYNQENETEFNQKATCYINGGFDKDIDLKESTSVLR